MDRNQANKVTQLMNKLERSEKQVEIINHGYSDEWVLTNRGFLINLDADIFLQIKGIIENNLLEVKKLLLENEIII